MINQPDVATGKQQRKTVDAIHEYLFDTLALDDIKTCFCVYRPECECYKPKPKMLLEAAREWKIDLSRSFMIGDRWRDVGAGEAAGCKTFSLLMVTKKSNLRIQILWLIVYWKLEFYYENFYDKVEI